MTYAEIQSLINTSLASGTKITALLHRGVADAILNFVQANLFQAGDLKLIKANVQYLNANFETNGLGKNLRLGWAICNGNNGTDNFAGRVPVGYGVGYSSLGQLAGSKDAVLVEHAHTYRKAVTGRGYRTANDDTPLSTLVDEQTNTQGVSGTDQNMQPYIVTLYIMKL